MILVKAYLNTDKDGNWVYLDEVHGNIEDLPIAFYGPFATIEAAISWMENDYADEAADVYDIVADIFEFPEGEVPYINDPKSIFGDVPDEDIRDDSQEIHGP